MYCQYSTSSDHDCGCTNKRSYRRCLNEARNAELDSRTDGAAHHRALGTDEVLVQEEYCSYIHCVDFIEMRLCKYAVKTEQKWLGKYASCLVYECHNPQAKMELKTFKNADGVDLNGVRRPCDEKFNLLPDADYLHVRSRFCNKEYCPYFTDQTDS